MTSFPNNTDLLILSFQKELPEIAFFNFEKLLVFGISQALRLYTETQVSDFAIPANRMMLPDTMASKEKVAEMVHMGHRYNCRYVLYGKLDPEIGPGERLNTIHISIALFDIVQEAFVFQVGYDYRDFEDKNAKVSQFVPSWSGLLELICWSSFMLIGGIYPTQSPKIWPSVQNFLHRFSFHDFQQLANAYYLTNQDAYSQKRLLLEELTMQNPDLFLSSLELGFLKKRMKNFFEACSALEWAFKKMSETTARQRAMCANELGVCYALSKDEEKAISWWKISLQEDPCFINPYLNLAHALETQNSLLEAEYYFIQAGEIAPTDSRVYGNLARLYSKQQLWEKALVQYEHQRLLEPTNPWIHSNIANCYLQQGDIDNAKLYLQKTLNIDPEGEAGRCAHLILSSLEAVELA